MLVWTQRPLRYVLLLPVAFHLVACDRSQTSSPPHEDTSACGLTGEPLSLADTFHQLRACLAERSLLAMEPYIDPASSGEVIELLVAVDELLVANKALLETLERDAPDMDLQPFDVSWLADNLDLFSRDVQYVSCKEDGDRGFVTVNVSNRPPLQEIEFVRQGDYWLYVPGPAEPEITKTIREIARAMDRIVFVVSSRKVSPDEIRNEYRLRVMPKVRALTASPTTAAAE